MPSTWIAEEHVVFMERVGRRSVGRIAVGLPLQVDADEATCEVALDGLYRKLVTIRGVSQFQALMLALRLIGTLLHDFVSKGGRVLDPNDDTDFRLDVLLGPLLCAPSPLTNDETD